MQPEKTKYTLNQFFLNCVESGITLIRNKEHSMFHLTAALIKYNFHIRERKQEVVITSFTVFTTYQFIGVNLTYFNGTNFKAG
jgi:hypothetical protein